MKSMKMRLKRWLFHFVMDQEGREPVAFWNTKRCVCCQQLLPFSSAYCFACGNTQIRDTEAISQLPTNKNLAVTLTGEIQAVRLPGERPVDTYNRLLNKKKVKELFG